MSTAPNPIVVRVFAKGGVDFVPLQQAIAHDLKCLMECRPDDASTIAGVFNNSIEAAAYVPTLKRTLREAREKRAAAGVKCKSCGKTVEPGRECYDMPLCYACLPPPAPLPINYPRSMSGDRNNCDGNVPATGNEVRP